MKIIDNISLKIGKDEVLRYQGYQKKIGKVNKVISQIVEEEIEKASILFEPKGIYDSFKIRDITISKKRIDLENGHSFGFNGSLTDDLRGAEYLVIGVVTIGDALEAKITNYFKMKEYSRGLTLDAIGTVAVRYLSKYIIGNICQEAKKQHLQVSKRFSPGNVEWDISEQKYIFEMMPVSKIGITLTESFMMTPKKSLSWGMGIGKDLIGISKENSSCKRCLAKMCQFRENS